jgi:small subunit ribosomal protein S4e
MHIKRITMPETWPLAKKGDKFIVRPKGPMPLELSMPLLVVLRDILHVVDNKNEAKKVLKDELVLVNGKIIKDNKYSIGLFDRLYVKKLDKGFSLVLDNHGLLKIHEITKDKIEKKPFRVIDKKILKKGKMQINFYGGLNMITNERLNVGDSAVIDLKSKKILDVLKLAKGSFVLVIRGKHRGEHGKIEDIDDFMTISVKNKKIKIPKENVFVIEENEIAK